MPTLAKYEVALHTKFPLAWAGTLWSWLNEPRAPNFDDFSPKTKAQFMVELGLRVTREITWAIHYDDRIVGYLAFKPMNPIFGQFHGLVIDPEFRGRGIGTEAFTAALTELIEQGFKSFLVMPYADNLPILKVIRNVGFRESGRILHATERDGDPVNLRVMTRGAD